jgi:hypothetical protein
VLLRGTTDVWEVVQGCRQPPTSVHPDQDVPLGHDVQEAWPDWELYVPAGHAVQTKPVLESEYVPEGQLPQVVDPAVEVCPGAHCWHDDAPGKIPEAVLAGHGVHAANPVLLLE